MPYHNPPYQRGQAEAQLLERWRREAQERRSEEVDLPPEAPLENGWRTGEMWGKQGKNLENPGETTEKTEENRGKTLKQMEENWGLESNLEEIGKTGKRHTHTHL